MKKMAKQKETNPLPYEMIVKNHHLYEQLHLVHNQDCQNLPEWKSQRGIILSLMKLKRLQLENK